MQKLQLKLQHGLDVSPHVKLGRVIRATVLALTPREIESYVCRAASENLCLAISQRRSAPEILDFDHSLPIPARITERQRIAGELALGLSRRLADKAELLVDSLDDWGFLAKPAAVLAAELSLAPREVEAMVVQLKQIPPGGVGSANLADYMLWQIDALPAGRDVELARRLVRRHFKLLGNLNLSALARALSCSVDEVVRICRQIVLRLRPFPLALSEGRTEFADPCATFKLDAAGKLSWEPCGESRYYVSALRPLAILGGRPQVDAVDFLAALRKDHAWARKLTQALAERQQLMARLLDFLLARESAYLSGDLVFPLGSSQAACCENLQVSPSTVSRLIQANAVVLPSGQIQWLREFFKPQGKLRNALWHEIQESGQHTFCGDRELAERVAAKGIVVSRRTVAKYRKRLGFENSFIRRKIAELKASADQQGRE